MQTAVLYTGTFDPFHRGHLWQLERTYRAHPFKKAVVGIITANPKKPNISDWQKRADLAKLILASREWPFEIEIHPIDYVTPEVLKQFTDKHLSDHSVIRTVASDVIVEFAEDAQYGFNEALLLYHYAVVVRPAVDKKAVERAVSQLPPHIAKDFSYQIVHVQTEGDISSTNIRRDVHDALNNGYITADQLAYIQKERLYS